MTALENEITVPDVPGVYPWEDRETLVLPGEVWKAHPLYVGVRFSSLGRVWSEASERFLNGQNGRNAGSPSRPGTSNSSPSYRRVWVKLPDGTRKKRNVSVLVLETFVGPRPDGHDCDHVNHDSLDDRLVNLRWRLRRDNRADTWR